MGIRGRNLHEFKDRACVSPIVAIRMYQILITLTLAQIKSCRLWHSKQIQKLVESIPLRGKGHVPINHSLVCSLRCLPKGLSCIYRGISYAARERSDNDRACARLEFQYICVRYKSKIITIIIK